MRTDLFEFALTQQLYSTAVVEQTYYRCKGLLLLLFFFFCEHSLKHRQCFMNALQHCRLWSLTRRDLATHACARARAHTLTHTHTHTHRNNTALLVRWWGTDTVTSCRHFLLFCHISLCFLTLVGAKIVCFSEMPLTTHYHFHKQAYLILAAKSTFFCGEKGGDM